MVNLLPHVLASLWLIWYVSPSHKTTQLVNPQTKMDLALHAPSEIPHQLA